MKKYTVPLLLFLMCHTICSAQLIPFRVGDQWGYSDTSGRLVIEPKYDLTDFFIGNAAFVTINNLFFLVNSKGELLSEGFQRHGQFVDGLCPVMNQSGKAFYINEIGENVFKTYFSAAENFSEGLAVVSDKKKSGVINLSGKWVLEPDFDSSSVYFKSGYLLVKKSGKFHYINNRGNYLLLPENFLPAGIFSEGLAAIYNVTKIIENNTSRTKYNLQFIDTTGKVVLSEFINDSLDYADYINYEKEFIDGKAIISVPNQLAYDRYFLDKNGKFSQVFSFTQHLGDSMFLGVVGYYLPSVRIYDPHFYVMGDFGIVLNSVGVFGDGLLAVQNKAGYWGYCDSNAREVIPFIYDSASAFKNGYGIIVKQGKFGVINKSGKEFFSEK